MSSVTDVDVKDALGVPRNISLPVTKPVSIASAQVASGAFASGALASGSVAAGAIAAGAAVDGSDLTQGVTTGAAVVTDANGTLQQYLRGLVKFFANALGAGTAAAAIRHTLASDDPAVATLGATTGTKVVTDANGTIQQYLRGLVTFFANALGTGVMAGSHRVTIATDDTLVAALAAPGGYSAAVTLTRTADTNSYLANDVLGAATGSTAALTFAAMGTSGKEVMITSVSLEIDQTSVISGQTSYVLHLYNVTPPSVYGDNVGPWDLASGDRASYLGAIQLGSPADLGSTLFVEAHGINKQVKLASTSLFGYLVTNGAYQPQSATVHVITLHSSDV